MKPKKFTGHFEEQSLAATGGRPQHYKHYRLEVGCFPPYTLAFGVARSISIRLVQCHFTHPQCVIIITRKKIFPYISNTKVTFFFITDPFSLCKGKLSKDHAKGDR